MNFFKKVFGIKTKDLYLAKLAKTEEVKYYGYSMYTTIYSVLVPNKYVLVRKTSNDKYKDQKNGSKYTLSSNSHHVDEVGVTDLEPILSEKRRISYKDAMDLLEEKNILNKEISTKNLYLAQLATLSSMTENEKKSHKHNSSKYVLVRKTPVFKNIVYRDLFTDTEYKHYSSFGINQGEVFVHCLEPIISDEQTITYYDADKILKTKNSVYIKK